MEKVLILTTDTIHHRYFCKELILKFKDVDFFVMEEIKKSRILFKDYFEIEQHLYEKKLWEYTPKLSPIKVRYKNHQASTNWILKSKPDLIVVYGTGRIGKDLIHHFKGKIVNLHGGDAERYRGLDSHLWTVYHNDFSHLRVTLHHVTEEFDAGNVISSGGLIPQINKDTELHHLRSLTTIKCVDMISKLIEDGSVSDGSLQSLLLCRYYSKMPDELIEDCKRKFNAYILKSFK